MKKRFIDINSEYLFNDIYSCKLDIKDNCQHEVIKGCDSCKYGYMKGERDNENSKYN